MFQEYEQLWAGEMAWWVNVLAVQEQSSEGLSLNPQHACEKPAMSPWPAHPGEGDRQC